MRFVISLAIIASAAFFGLAVPGNTAENKAVTACLSGSAYLDAVETIDLCDKALEARTASTETLSAINLQVGEALYFLGQPGVAIQYLDQAIKLNAASAQAFRRRGWANLRLENFSSGMADFTEFLALSPDNPDALFALAFARDAANHDCAAVAKDLERILEHHPDHHLSRWSLASKYACVDGHSVRQLEELNKILAAGRATIADTNYFGRRGRTDRDFFAVVLEERAGIYFDTDQNDKAIADYSWLIDNYPSYPNAFLNRSVLRLNTGDAGGALLDADAVLSMFPDMPAAQTARLRALNSLKRDQDSIEFASNVLSRGYVSPETPRIYFFRAVAYKRLARKSEALEDFKRAMASGERIGWAVHTQLAQSGYLFGSLRDRTFDDGGPPLDTSAKEITNALAACLIDPECMK